jgi:hypothetical protein
MRRCIFIGPSYHGIRARPPGIVFRPPARSGDIIGAVQEGFESIGLIDGYFGSCASVWHKEILHALSMRCHVYGAASMGALRAAECHAFGMRPVGKIALDYINGSLIDDADVALLHGPEEIDYAPFTETMVEVALTLKAMESAHAVSAQEVELLRFSAKALHFEDRTVDAIVAGAISSSGRVMEVMHLFEVHRVRQKQIDASLLIAEMQSGSSPQSLPSKPWSLAQSQSLSRLLHRRDGEASSAKPAPRKVLY